MLFLILFFPFFGFISGSLFGRFLGTGTCIVSTFFTFLSFILSLALLHDIINTGNVYTFYLFP